MDSPDQHQAVAPSLLRRIDHRFADGAHDLPGANLLGNACFLTGGISLQFGVADLVSCRPQLRRRCSGRGKHRRAADLIGQLADPLYSRKLNALFHEFAEIGCNERLGYQTPADLADQYPNFFWGKVEPFIGHALAYLELTVDGRQWVANLYANLFEMEQGRRNMGP
jgi:hypothetical protein